MDIINKLFHDHKGNLIPDDENIEIIVANYLQTWTRNDCFKFLAELNEDQLQMIVKSYITEELLKKMSEDDFT